jgi:hypothetical protein
VSGIVANDITAAARENGAAPERRVTITLRTGLTPGLAYAAIADNPRWTFTGSTLTIPIAEFGSDLLGGIEHTLRVLAETKRKERLSGTKQKTKKT